MEPDLDAPATKRDLVELEAKLDAKLDKLEAKLDAKLDAKLACHPTRDEMISMEERITRSVADEIGRSASVMMEHMTALFRVADDRTTSVAQRLDEHIADASVHRAPGRRAR